MPADFSTPEQPPVGASLVEPAAVVAAPDQPGPALFRALPNQALTLLRLSLAAVVVVFVVVVAVIELGLRYGGDVDLPWPVLVPALVVGLVGLGAGVWWTGRSYRAWRYQLTPDRLRVEYGVVTTRSAVLPRSRVQHVSTERGPLQRSLGLVTLTVHTAGANTPNVSIPNLLTDDADEMRRELIDGRP